MKRKLLIFTTVLLLVLACAVPAWAADIDYNDYIVDVQSDGTTDNVTVAIPLDKLTSPFWRVWTSNYQHVVDKYGLSITYTFGNTADYVLTFGPLKGDYLDLRDIPNGTDISFLFSCIGASYSGDSGIKAWISVTYFDANHVQCGYLNYPKVSGQFLEDTLLTCTLDKPSEAVYAQFSVSWESFHSLDTGAVTITCKEFTMELSISAMTRLQQETGRTNKLLEQIQGTVDEFINREPEPNPPEFSDSMNDSLQAEQNILDRLPMASVLEEFRNKESLVGDGIIANTEAFRLFVLIWDKFFLYCSWYDFLIYFSLCTGCLMAFLGITTAFMSRKVGGNG